MVLELWIIEVLVNPYYGHLQVGKFLATPKESVMALLTTLHWLCTEISFFLIVIKNNIYSGILFFSMSLLHHFYIVSERVRIIAPLTICENEM